MNSVPCEIAAHDSLMHALTSPVGLRRLALTATSLREARRAVEERDGDRIWAALDTEAREKIEEAASSLEGQGVRMLVRGDPEWPTSLEALRTPPLYLFLWGNIALLGHRGIGMCGSRKAGERGLAAARTCGTTAADLGLQVVSGYAAGVDTETHLAALRAGACTTIVLPEGIANFRVKRAYTQAGLDTRNTLVISQFPPHQRWTAGGAMTRNGLICTLGNALIVIEAGDRGGTLNAGRQALKVGRPVLALEFGEEGEATPPGNQILFDEGAHRVRTKGHLIEELRALGVTQ